MLFNLKGSIVINLNLRLMKNWTLTVIFRLKNPSALSPILTSFTAPSKTAVNVSPIRIPSVAIWKRAMA